MPIASFSALEQLKVSLWVSKCPLAGPISAWGLLAHQSVLTRGVRVELISPIPCHPLQDRRGGWMLGNQLQLLHTAALPLTSTSPTTETDISPLCSHGTLLVLATQSVLPKNDVWIFPPTPPNCEYFHSQGDFLFTFESLVPTRKPSTCQVLNKCLKKLIQLHWFPLFWGHRNSQQFST